LVCVGFVWGSVCDLSPGINCCGRPRSGPGFLSDQLCLLSFIISFLYVCVCVYFVQLAPTTGTSLMKSMKIVENPVSVCNQVYTLVKSLTAQIRRRMEDPTSAGEWTRPPPCSHSHSTQIIHEGGAVGRMKPHTSLAVEKWRAVPKAARSIVDGRLQPLELLPTPRDPVSKSWCYCERYVLVIF